jgi:hypothetical protein
LGEETESDSKTHNLKTHTKKSNSRDPLHSVMDFSVFE